MSIAEILIIVITVLVLFLLIFAVVKGARHLLTLQDRVKRIEKNLQDRNPSL